MYSSVAISGHVPCMIYLTVVSPIFLIYSLVLSYGMMSSFSEGSNNGWCIPDFTLIYIT